MGTVPICPSDDLDSNSETVPGLLVSILDQKMAMKGSELDTQTSWSHRTLCSFPVSAGVLTLSFFYRTMEKPNISSLLQFHSCCLQGTPSSPVYQPLGFGTTIIPVLLFLLIWAPSTFKLLCLAHPWPLSAVTELSLSLVQANGPHSAEMWLPP